MNIRKTVTSLLAFWLFGVLLVVGQDVNLPEGVTMNASVEGITEYQLENGLKVLLFPDPSKPQVTVNVTYLVGSRHEDYGETGMAHLLEHLVFKGTPTRPDIAKELKDHGASFNGTTWYDRTNYFETVSATDENLEWAIAMEADRMVNSNIAKEDLDSEMTVVRNEFEIGENDPSGILMERVMSTAYLWHNYGKTTIGARADIENVPIERLQAFYREYYQPDNAVLTIAGKFDTEKTLNWVQEYFGAIPKPEREIMLTYTREPVQDGERSVTLRRTGDVQVVSAAYHISPAVHPDYPALAVLTEVLADEPSGRLYKAMVESKKASTLFGYSAALKEPGFIYFSADVLKEKSLEEAKDAMVNLLDNLLDEPITEEEVDRGRTSLLKNWELAFNDSRRVGTLISEYIAKGDWRLMFLYRDYLEDVTVDDVMRVAENYLKPSNRTIGYFIPESEPDRAEIPDVDDVQALVADYKGREAIAQGEEFDPSPENIESRVSREENKNAIDLALLPKETRGDAVVARMTFRFGDLEKLKGTGNVSGMTASMLNKGTQSKTRQEIQDAFNQLKARVFFGGGANNVSVNIETERDALPEVIKLVGEIMKSPSFPEEEFEKLKEEQLANIESQRSDPMYKTQISFFRTLNPYPEDDPRYIATPDEEIEGIKETTLDDLKAFYEEFYGATDATVSVVGDFDETEIEQLIMEEFGDWDSPVKFERIASKVFDVEPKNEKIETPDKANAVFFAGFVLPMRDDHPDYPAMVIANYMLGGGGLSSRLANRIRQQDGLSYAVGSFLSASSLDERAQFVTYAMYAPENLEKLEAAFNEEIQKALEGGFTAEELADAKKGWLQNQVVGRSQDGSLAGTLNSYLYINRDMMWDADLESKVENLTLEQVNQALKKHLKPEKFVVVKAGDFENAAKKAAEGEGTTMDAGDVSADDVIDNFLEASGGEEKLAAIKSFKMVSKGTVQNMEITSTQYQKEPNKMLMEIAAGGNVMQKIVFDGEQGAIEAMGQVNPMPAEMVAEMKSETIIPELHYGKNGVKAEVKGMEKVNEEEAYKLEITDGNGKISTVYFSKNTGFKIREVESEQGQTQTTDYGNYAEVDGIMMPHTITISGAMPFPLELNAESIELNLDLDDSLFMVKKP